MIVFEYLLCDSLIRDPSPSFIIQNTKHATKWQSCESCWSTAEMQRENFNGLQCWPTSWSMAVFLCKAAAHGSTPLREKWFWLWAPLKLWAAQQINTTQKFCVYFITAKSTQNAGKEGWISIYIYFAVMLSIHHFSETLVRQHFNIHFSTANWSRKHRCIKVMGHSTNYTLKLCFSYTVMLI